MTREEAISILEKHKYSYTCGYERLEKSNEAIDMAIEALKENYCEERKRGECPFYAS